MPDDVHLWFFDLSSNQLDIDMACLNPQEVQRAQRFHFNRDARRYIVAHATLRRVLSTYLSIPTQAIHFAFNSFGKPRLCSAHHSDTLVFNLSHSHERALIGISRRGRLGVDLEQHKKNDDLLNMALRYFSPQEISLLEQTPAGTRMDVFFKLWTCKEAFLKALGKGLSIPLDSFSISFRVGQSAPTVEHPGTSEQGWRVAVMQPEPGYRAALAIDKPDCQITLGQL